MLLYIFLRCQSIVYLFQLYLQREKGSSTKVTVNDCLYSAIIIFLNEIQFVKKMGQLEAVPSCILSSLFYSIYSHSLFHLFLNPPLLYTYICVLIYLSFSHFVAYTSKRLSGAYVKKLPLRSLIHLYSPNPTSSHCYYTVWCTLFVLQSTWSCTHIKSHNAIWKGQQHVLEQSYSKWLFKQFHSHLWIS